MMKKLVVLAGIGLIGMLVWLAAGTDRPSDAVRMVAPRAMGASPAIVTPPAAQNSAVGTAGETATAPVPAEVLAPILTSTAPTPVPADAAPVMRDPDSPRPMIVPVAGVARSAMRDMFNEVRGNKRHEAIDILAPRGTPIVATDDGVVKKLFTSVPGGLTIYEFDPDQRFCYYYAHLDSYAPGLHEGQLLHHGDVIGYVGTTGNAPKDTPHLHFALIRLDLERRWWKGTYVNPYPYLAGKNSP